jgi:hypothetical protein
MMNRHSTPIHSRRNAATANHLNGKKVRFPELREAIHSMEIHDTLIWTEGLTGVIDMSKTERRKLTYCVLNYANEVEIYVHIFQSLKALYVIRLSPDEVKYGQLLDKQNDS